MHARDAVVGCVGRIIGCIASPGETPGEMMYMNTRHEPNDPARSHSRTLPRCLVHPMGKRAKEVDGNTGASSTGS